MDITNTKHLLWKSRARWTPILGAAAAAVLLITSHGWASSFGGAALWATVPDANLEYLQFCLEETRAEESDPAEYYRQFPARYQELLAKVSERIESELIPRATSAEEIERMRSLLDTARKVGDAMKRR